MSADPRIGTTLAGYRIESVVGRGGMGVVYLAEHLRLSRRVALKILPPELAEDQRFRDRFIHESKLAASLDHPNIVDIYDAGEADGLVYLAMRYVGGRDLKTLIAREGALGPERTAALLTQVAGALDAAHQRGLVHRDIKSANVLVEPPTGSLGEHAYLTDFGLTKRPESMSGLTKTGQFLGSVEYAAPEQFEGKPIDARTDIYALGCVAYECLTGEVPFRRETEAAVMYAHLREPPPMVTGTRPDLPVGFDAVVSKAMAKRPEERYPSAGALSQALGEAARGELAGPAAPPTRRRKVLMGAAAVLVVGAVLGLVLATRGGGKPEAGGSPSAGPSPPALVGVIRLDPQGNVVAKTPLDMGVSDVPYDKSIAIGEGAVWVMDAQSVRLFKLNPSSNSLIATLEPPSPVGVVTGDGSAWLGPDFFRNQGIVSRVDPGTNAVTEFVHMPSGCCQAQTFESGALWLLAGSARVFRVDARTGRVGKPIPVSGQALTAGDGTVWALDTVLGKLTPIDPKTSNAGRPILLEGSPFAVAAGGGSVWVAGKDGKVLKVTPGQGLESVVLDGNPELNAIAFDPSGVWVAAPKEGAVWRLDPDSPAKQPQRFAIGGIPSELAIGDGAVWVVEEPPSDIWQP
jgi:sugar lactone lactonase YvrE